MNLGVLTLKDNATLEEKHDDLTKAKLPVIGVAGAGTHLLVRIDDTDRTADSIVAENDFIETAELITGAAKDQLIANFTNHGAVSVSVLA